MTKTIRIVHTEDGPVRLEGTGYATRCAAAIVHENVPDALWALEVLNRFGHLVPHPATAPAVQAASNPKPKIGDWVELKPETQDRYVILWRRGDTRAKVRSVGRKNLHLTTSGGVNITVEQDLVTAVA